jgi:hypothetical protein
MSNLHIYHDNHSEWVVASSAEEAKELLLKSMGMSEEEWGGDLEMTQLPDDKDFGIYFEDTPKDLTDEEANEWLDQDPNNGWKKLTKTCTEWAEIHGRGHLSSSECY